MSIGKDYQKGDPIRGAAVLVLTFELMGNTPAGTSVLVESALRDLGVSEQEARAYLTKHRTELMELVKKQGVV
jgi:hypothetical protein